jgi:hypothetical protein
VHLCEKLPFIRACFQASAAPRSENSDTEEKYALFLALIIFKIDTIFFFTKPSFITKKFCLRLGIIIIQFAAGLKTLTKPEVFVPDHQLILPIQKSFGNDVNVDSFLILWFPQNDSLAEINHEDKFLDYSS